MGYLDFAASKVIHFEGGEETLVKDKEQDIEHSSGYAIYLTPEQYNDLNKLLLEANHLSNKWMHL